MHGSKLLHGRRTPYARASHPSQYSRAPWPMSRCLQYGQEKDRNTPKYTGPRLQHGHQATFITSFSATAKPTSATSIQPAPTTPAMTDAHPHRSTDAQPNGSAMMDAQFQAHGWTMKRARAPRLIMIPTARFDQHPCSAITSCRLAVLASLDGRPINPAGIVDTVNFTYT